MASEESAKRNASELLGYIFLVPGLAAAIMANEVTRMPGLITVGLNANLAVWAIGLSVLAMLAMLLLYRAKPGFRITRFPGVVIFLAALLSAFEVIFLIYSNSGRFSDASFVAVTAVMRTLAALLYVEWAEVLLMHGARKAMIGFAWAMFIVAPMRFFFEFVPLGVGIAFYAIIPLVSGALLLLFRRVSAAQIQGIDTLSFSEKDLSADTLFKMSKVDATFFPTDENENRRLSWSLPLILFFYTAVFGIIQRNWFPLQNEPSFAILIDLAYAIGYLSAAIIMYLLATRFLSRAHFDVYRAIILPVVMVALYLSTVFSGEQSWVFAAPLSMAQRLSFFFFLTPFLIQDERDAMVSFCLSQVAYRAGLMIAGISRSISLPQEFWNGVVIVTLALLTIWSFALLLSGRNANSQAAGAGDSAGASTSEPVAESDKPKRPSFKEVCAAIAKEYSLTPREQEVMEMLLKGRSAARIAEELVISKGTVKGYIHNVYTKVDVHSQQELIDFFELKTSENTSLPSV